MYINSTKMDIVKCMSAISESGYISKLLLLKQSKYEPFHTDICISYLCDSRAITPLTDVPKNILVRTLNNVSHMRRFINNGSVCAVKSVLTELKYIENQSIIDYIKRHGRYELVELVTPKPLSTFDDFLFKLKIHGDIEINQSTIEYLKLEKYKSVIVQSISTIIEKHKIHVLETCIATGIIKGQMLTKEYLLIA